MKNDNQVKCPSCGTSIDVQDILAHQLEDEIKQKYQAQLANDKKIQEDLFLQLKKDREAFEIAKKQENELFQERLEKQLKLDKISLEEKLKLKYKIIS